MRILCVCRSGIFRSVKTKRVLNGRGFDDVLAVGGLKVSQETMDMLCEWADLILLAKPIHGGRIKSKFRDKIDVGFHIGSDMENIVKKQLDKIGLS